MFHRPGGVAGIREGGTERMGDRRWAGPAAGRPPTSGSKNVEPIAPGALSPWLLGWAGVAGDLGDDYFGDALVPGGRAVSWSRRVMRTWRATESGGGSEVCLRWSL